MGSKSRSKGAGAEREAAAALRALGVHVERTARNGVDGGVDVQGSGLAVEVKRRRRSPAVARWLAQSRNSAAKTRDSLVPIVMTRGDHDDWVVVVALADLDALASRIAQARLQLMP